MSGVSTYIGYVTIKAPDFNGQDFDGSPFSANPPWLKGAIEANKIRVVAADRDYALFDIDTPDGVVRAEPDDRIEYRQGNLVVFRRGEWYKVRPRADDMPDRE